MHEGNFQRLSGFDFGLWDGLEKAAHALEDHGLKEICFSRVASLAGRGTGREGVCFKRETGITPSKYRHG